MTSAERANDTALLRAAKPHMRSLPKFADDAFTWYCTRSFLSDQAYAEKSAALRAQDSKQNINDNPHLDGIWKSLIQVVPKQQLKAVNPKLYFSNSTYFYCSSVGSFNICLHSTQDLHNLSDAQLAFFLAHEIAHNALGHYRQSLSKYACVQAVKKPLVISKGMRFDPDAATAFYFDPWIEEEADIYAIQLCTLAGFKIQDCLDALRHCHQKTFNCHPDLHSHAAQRFYYVHHYLNGTVTGKQYGLHQLLDNQLQFTQHVEQQRAHVILVHGIASKEERFLDSAQYLQNSLGSGYNIFTFNYPNDHSLYSSSVFLEKEIARLQLDYKNIHFVCHSAGGLLCRSLLDIRQHQAASISFIGTPQQGSHFAELQEFLECIEFLQLSRLGFKHAHMRVAQDGRECMAIDLQAHSLFLNLLAQESAKQQTPTTSAVFYGKALGPRSATALRASFNIAKHQLAKRINTDSALKRAQVQFVQSLHLPKEVTDGDIAVTCDSAQLNTAIFKKMYALKHWELPRDEMVLQDVSTFIKQQSN